MGNQIFKTSKSISQERVLSTGFPVTRQRLDSNGWIFTEDHQPTGPEYPMILAYDISTDMTSLLDYNECTGLYVNIDDLTEHEFCVDFWKPVNPPYLKPGAGDCEDYA